MWFCCRCAVRLFGVGVMCGFGLVGFGFLLILADWFAFAACCYKCVLVGWCGWVWGCLCLDLSCWF